MSKKRHKKSTPSKRTINLKLQSQNNQEIWDTTKKMDSMSNKNRKNRSKSQKILSTKSQKKMFLTGPEGLRWAH